MIDFSCPRSVKHSLSKSTLCKPKASSHTTVVFITTTHHLKSKHLHERPYVVIHCKTVEIPKIRLSRRWYLSFNWFLILCKRKIDRSAVWWYTSKLSTIWIIIINVYKWFKICSQYIDSESYDDDSNTGCRNRRLDHVDEKQLFVSWGILT